MAWQFQREEQQFPQIPEGRYRIRIKSAEITKSKNSGNDMLVLQFEVSGYAQILYNYITFMEDKPEITNRMLTQFFDSFSGIPEGDLNLQNWIGKVGACTVKHEDYNGQDRAKIGYFIPASKQDDLPPWKTKGGSTVDSDGFVNLSGAADDIELPFV